MPVLTRILEWIKKQLAWIALAVFVFCMVACFVSGCNYHKKNNPCPEPTIVTHTVIIHDTVTHTIDKWHYVQNTDTIIYIDTIIQPVDTAEILKDYFALHVYSRHWEDSLLKVSLHDTVTQNRFLQNGFTYQILRPQTVINTTVDNSVNYNRYIFGGLDIPLYYTNGIELELFYAFEKGYIGAGYAPLEKSGSIKAGFSLFKFKK